MIWYSAGYIHKQSKNTVAIMLEHAIPRQLDIENAEQQEMNPRRVVGKETIPLNRADNMVTHGKYHAPDKFSYLTSRKFKANIASEAYLHNRAQFRSHNMQGDWSPRDGYRCMTPQQFQEFMSVSCMMSWVPDPVLSIPFQIDGNLPSHPHPKCTNTASPSGGKWAVRGGPHEVTRSLTVAKQLIGRMQRQEIQTGKCSFLDVFHDGDYLGAQFACCGLLLTSFASQQTYSNTMPYISKIATGRILDMPFSSINLNVSTFYMAMLYCTVPCDSTGLEHETDPAIP
ncbi:hypothetical protein BO99DRAFT_411329 [Aspergillus violaceofuscus CBS 115571]|uniref:Uncharacterized protein n=1 Tax=Aspergillus violaceofuscus (strain CBS 115571) TaxID=1450538 RepID=A0A2V5HI23_ASPV1|nr:hypothetical protein BO99DRAFT_411329 [Aspergillus violaceofuscus CBS 115571]